MEVVVRRCAGVVVLLLVSAFDVGAQSAFIAGKVTRDNGDPMGGVAVAVEELKREVRAAEDGAYRVDNVPPGNYHVSVRAEGEELVVQAPEAAMSPLVLSELRDRKRQMLAVLTGACCRYCDGPIDWRRSAVAFADGTAGHVGCYEEAEVARLLASAKRALRNIVACSGEGEMVEGSKS